MRAGGPLRGIWSRLQKNKENFPRNNSLFFHLQVEVLTDFSFGIISMFVDTSQKQRIALLLHNIKPKTSGLFCLFIWGFFPPHFIF